MGDKNYTHRILLISDPHYMSDGTREEYKLLYPDAKPSGAAGDAYGYTQKQKIDFILEDLNAFMEKEPVESVLILGDLGTDDYSFRNLPVNYCLKFKEECMDKLGCDSYALPGNHDSYPNDMWYDIFQYDRQYSVKIGDAAFIMLDTFQGGVAKDGGGSPYTGVDIEWLEQELKKYPTENIFLCTHGLSQKKHDPKFTEFLAKNERVVCVFVGHIHKNEVMRLKELDDRYLINVSGYCFINEIRDGKWVFDRFHEECAWGYGVLEWNETEMHYYHVKNPRIYKGSNGIFDYQGAIEDELLIPFLTENGK